MLSSFRAKISARLVLVCTLWFLQAGYAQTFDFGHDRVQMAELEGLWRFHTGDDLRWADPAFDDSSWALLRSGKPWTDQGYAQYGGMAWYRFTVTMPAKHGPMAMRFTNFGWNYQVFVNGQSVWQQGTMPPHVSPYTGTPAHFTIPDALIDSGAPIHFAIRVWGWPVMTRYYGGGPHGPVQLGSPPILDALTARTLDSVFRSDTSILMQITLAALLALGALILFLFQRKEKESLLFALYEALYGGTWAIFVYLQFAPHRIEPWDYLPDLGTVAIAISFLPFFWKLMGRQREVYYWIALVSASLSVLPLLAGNFEWLNPPQSSYWFGICFVPYQIAVAIFLVQQARNKNLDAKLLLGPMLFFFAATLANPLFSAYVMLHPEGAGRFSWFNQAIADPFPVSVQDIASVLLQLSILAVLLLRFARNRRQQQSLHSELEAARLVQQVLIPEDIPTVPGYQIESVYKPAGEVGGDFFQIIPLKSGSALIAIGDVSGKGVPAAMTVSLLVGTLRTLSYFSQSPRLILGAMNDSVAGRSTGGFTTCLVARIDPDGTVTLANAGHLAPYLGQREIELDNGLPLGLVAKTGYVEMAMSLGESQQITFLTDGVVEARSKHGELFGFERTAAVLSKSARNIASAAAKFGQEDDITVVTLKRLPDEASGKTQAFAYPVAPPTA